MAVLGGHLAQGAQQVRGPDDEHLLLQLRAAVQLHVERLVEQAGGLTELVAAGDLGEVEALLGLPELVDEVGPGLGERLLGEVAGAVAAAWSRWSRARCSRGLWAAYRVRPAAVIVASSCSMLMKGHHVASSASLAPMAVTVVGSW
ncbi:hypothetical protein ACFV0W_40125 [Streptomyces anulatus]